jgi:site-specific DNA-methyltransferase (cytosine-N4-specific)
MKPYYETENGKLFCGDILEGFKAIPDNSVNCVITSPPYWQLRDYGYPEQWGLEPTFQEYLSHLWQMMDEIWRVLKDDGTVWINLGDTYSASGGQGNQHKQAKVFGNFSPHKTPGMPNKCLLLIPHRFAIGCIDHGWIMRNDITWAKRNGMPEPVNDRFAKKHEYFFFMVKSQKYYFDLESIRDKCKPLNRWGGKKLIAKGVSEWDKGSKQNSYRSRDMQPNNGMKNPGDVSDFWDIPTKPSSKKHYATYNFDLIDKCIIAGCPKGGTILDPFNGSGTTTLRAEQLDRKWIGIDGSEEYSKIAKEAIENERVQLKLNYA